MFDDTREFYLYPQYDPDYFYDNDGSRDDEIDIIDIIDFGYEHYLEQNLLFELKAIPDYKKSEWLDDYIKLIAPPSKSPTIPLFDFDQKQWFIEQLSHIPVELQPLARQKYKYASTNGKTDGECLRDSNSWLQEIVKKLKEHPLDGTMHYSELARQIIQNEYHAPDRALDNFTPWILKNTGLDDGEIKNIARDMSQQFNATQKNDTNNSGNSIINKQKITSKLGQFWHGFATKNIDRDELIKQISLSLRHAAPVFNIAKFKTWSPNYYTENATIISNFFRVFIKQTRGERERNSEPNPFCPTSWATKHCHNQSMQHIKKLSDDIISELNINPELINESFMRNRLGVYADPFFREKDPIKPNEKNLRRQLRKAFKQANEMAALCLRKVSSRGQRYVSDFTLSKRTHQINAQTDWIDRTTCESGDKKIPLRHCVRTPEAKIAEVLKMSQGLEEFFGERGDKAIFITLTAPSSFHPNPTYGKSSWDGSSPLEAHRWFTQNWKLFRTSLSDANIKFDGIRVIEPHRDGCPHAHVLMHVKQSKYEKVKKLLNEYFAHSEKAVKIEEIDPNKGTATGYLLKYVVKNVTGASSDADIQDSAARADAFRSTWSIRAFSYFGILRGRITTWRELRRLETQPDEKFARSLWRAARASNSYEFIKLLANKDKKDEIKTIREPVSTGQFTEPDTDGEIKPILVQGRILGIVINNVDYITHPTKWTLVSLVRTDDSIEKTDSAIMHSCPRNPNFNPEPDPHPITESQEFT